MVNRQQATKVDRVLASEVTRFMAVASETNRKGWKDVLRGFFQWYATKYGIGFREAATLLTEMIDDDPNRLRSICTVFIEEKGKVSLWQ